MSEQCKRCEGDGTVPDPRWSDAVEMVCPDCDGSGAIGLEYACGTCGEPDGSVYAKRCCASDNMVEQ